MNDDCHGEVVGPIGTDTQYSAELLTSPTPSLTSWSAGRVSDGIRELIEATASVFGSGAIGDADDCAGDDDLDDADDDITMDDVELAASAELPAVSRKVAKPRIRTRRTRMRSKTIALKRLTRAELHRGALANPPVEDAERPLTRSECADMPRPCPWVACKHHLYLDINPRTGSIKINFPDLEPWELKQTCALDVADNGGLTLEEIGLITNLTRERVRQVEVRGLLTLKASARQLR
jgi:Sigma-70, region 4